MRRTLKPVSLLVMPVILVSLMFSGPSAQAKPLSEGGFLGVYTRDLDIALTEALNFSEDGVLIEDVVKDSPADEAGLKPGDILTGINDRTIASPRSLERALWRTDPGEEVAVSYWRDGKSERVSIKLADKPEETDKDVFIWKHGSPFFAFSRSGAGDDSTGIEIHRPGYLGVNLHDLEDQLLAYFEVKDGGVLIEEITEDSPAEKAGLKAGDVIVAIDNDPMMDSGDVVKKIREKEKGDVVEVKVVRKGKEKTLKATLDEQEDLLWYGQNFGKKFKSMVDHINLSDIDIDVDMDEMMKDIDHEARTYIRYGGAK